MASVCVTVLARGRPQPSMITLFLLILSLNQLGPCSVVLPIVGSAADTLQESLAWLPAGSGLGKVHSSGHML